MNSTSPSLDAARHFEPRLVETDAANQAIAQDVSAGRAAVAAIKAIPQALFTPAVCAQLVAVLSGKVAAGYWSSTSLGEVAGLVLDDLHDDLEGGAL